MIFLANAEKLTFVILRNFQVLFFPSYQIKLLQGALIVFSFIIMIHIFTVFFVYRKLYKKLYKYFLGNMFRVKGSFSLAFTVYAVKPVILGAIHGIMF